MVAAIACGTNPKALSWGARSGMADHHPSDVGPARDRAAGEDDALPPALVLGGDFTALGVMRSLGRRGIRLFAHGTEQAHARWSRWFRPLPDVPAGLSAEALLDRLAGGSHGRLVLLPCSDPWLRAAARRVAEGPGGLLASLPPPDTVEAFVDKGRLAGLLEAHGVPHPRTVVARGPAEVESAVGSLPGSAFLKPRDSHAFQARFGVKAFRTTQAAEAAARGREAAESGLEMLVQEYVPGPATCHYFLDGFVDRTGTVRAVFARRRLRMWPPDFGNSTSMVSVPVPEAAPAAADLERLLAGTGYRGIFSAEFKRDPRDGRFKLLEVNARPWWFVEFAERAGVNVCEMAFRDAIGLPVETVGSYRVGVRCVHPSFDRLACADLVRKGELGRAEWLRSWLGAHQPLLSLSDPLPGLVDTAGIVLRRLRPPRGWSRGRAEKDR
jgi:predicted ATP-grasp superfamily ATP-dependent carboligase